MEAALAAAVVGLAGRRLGWLTAGGAWAAALVGTAVFGCGGWAGAVPLLAFFVTATLLGHLPGRSRHGARNAAQVAANGGPAAVLAVIAAVTRNPAAALALAASLAAANADTWATEVGGRYGGAPRALGFGRRLEAGASGGVTVIGTLAGAAGALLVAALAGVMGTPHAWLAGVGGTLGMLLDSLLGGTLQAVYRCPACGARLESPAHPCPAPLRLVRGWAWLGNDGVNLAATGLTAAAVLAAGRLLT